MNRFILKYAYPITAVILVIFAWVIYRRIAQGWSETITLAVAAVIVWAVGAPTLPMMATTVNTGTTSPSLQGP